MESSQVRSFQRRVINTVCPDDDQCSPELSGCVVREKNLFASVAVCSTLNGAKASIETLENAGRFGKCTH